MSLYLYSQGYYTLYSCCGFLKSQICIRSFELGLPSQALSEAQSMMSSASTDEAKAEAQIAVEVAEELLKATA